MADLDDETTPLHLAIIGGGVAGCAAADWASAHGAQVTLFNAGIPLGGSCIHLGTFPARILMSAATDHKRAVDPRFAGIRSTAETPDWTTLNQTRQQCSDRVGRDYNELFDSRANVEVVARRATFTGPTTLEAGGESFHPDRVLLTPGSRSSWPDLDGLDESSPIAVGEIGDLEELPANILFLETSFVALAYAQLLARLGTEVVILTQKSRIFEDQQSADISTAMHQLLTDDGVKIVTKVTATHIEQQDVGIRLMGTTTGRPSHWDTNHLVIVDHYQPRIEDLGLSDAEIDVTDQGFIVIDGSLQTTNPNVFAAGDAIGRGQHAYAAAYDAVLAARNAISPSRTAGHNTAVPFAIYTDPQLAGVGWDEKRAQSAGFSVDTAICSFTDLPAANALGYPEGFVKLIRDGRSDHLLGARILSPNASELIMELAIAVRYGLTISDLATMVHPPISMGEAISQAARTFETRKPTASNQLPGRTNP